MPLFKIMMTNIKKCFWWGKNIHKFGKNQIRQRCEHYRGLLGLGRVWNRRRLTRHTYVVRLCLLLSFHRDKYYRKLWHDCDEKCDKNISVFMCLPLVQSYRMCPIWENLFIFAKQKSRPVALSSTMLLILWKIWALCILKGQIGNHAENIKSHVMRRKHVPF